MVEGQAIKILDMDFIEIPEIQKAPKRYLRFLFHGEIGTGKSSICGTFPNVFICDYEDKMVSLWRDGLLWPEGPIGYWIIDGGDTWMDVEYFTYLFLFDKRDKVAEFLAEKSRPGKKLVEYKNRKEYIDVDWGPRKASQGEWGIGNRETFVDDSLTQMAKMVMTEAIQKHMDAPGKSETGGASRIVGDVIHPAPAAYGTRDAMIERRMNLFRDKINEINYVLTCHLAMESVDELGGARRLLPAITGKALPPILATYFDESYEMKKAVFGEGDKKISKFTIDTEGTSARLTLRSSIGLKAGVRSHWSSIQEAIDRGKK